MSGVLDQTKHFQLQTLRAGPRVFKCLLKGSGQALLSFLYEAVMLWNWGAIIEPCLPAKINVCPYIIKRHKKKNGWK